jgi:hypothetical protein
MTKLSPKKMKNRSQTTFTTLHAPAKELCPANNFTKLSFDAI